MILLTILIFLFLAYVNVSAIADIKYRMNYMRIKETFLRFFWAVLVMFIMVVAIYILLIY